LLACQSVHAFTISGTVYWGGSPLPLANVVAIDATTQLPAGGMLTDAGGGYSILAPRMTLMYYNFGRRCRARRYFTR